MLPSWCPRRIRKPRFRFVLDKRKDRLGQLERRLRRYLSIFDLRIPLLYNNRSPAETNRKLQIRQPPGGCAGHQRKHPSRPSLEFPRNSSVVDNRQYSVQRFIRYHARKQVFPRLSCGHYVRMVGRVVSVHLLIRACRIRNLLGRQQIPGTSRIRLYRRLRWAVRFRFGRAHRSAERVSHRITNTRTEVHVENVLSEKSIRQSVNDYRHAPKMRSPADHRPARA